MSKFIFIREVNLSEVGVRVLGKQAPGKVQKDSPELTVRPPVLSANTTERLLNRVVLRNRFSEIISVFSFVFLMSRAPLPPGVFPGAAPCVFAQRRDGFLIQIIIGMAVFAGTWSVTTISNALWLSLPLFFFNLFLSLCQLCRAHNTYRWYSYGVWSGWRLLTTLLRDGTPAAFYHTGIEIGVGLGLLIFFQLGFDFLANPGNISKWSMVGLAVLAGVGLGGTTGLSVYSLQVAEVALVFLLTTVTYLCGGGAGMIMGMIMAVISGLANGSLMLKLALFGMAGVLAVLFKDFGKWGTISGACIGFYLLSGQPQWGLAGNSQLLSWGGGLMGFALAPRRFFIWLSDYLPGQTQNTIERQQKLKETISNRLNGIAKIFEEIARDFNAESKENDFSQFDLYSLLDQVRVKNCQHCNQYEICWVKNFYTTYRELFDLMAGAELYGEVGMEHLKGKLRQTCYQQYKLITTVNHSFEKFQQNLFWQSKYENGKNLLTCQLQGMAAFITDLATEVTNDHLFKDGFEAGIKYSLNRLGITAREVIVSAFGSEGLEIRICQKGCKRNRECQNLIAPMLENILGQKYMVWNKRCSLEAGYCYYVLIPAFRYDIATIVCRLPKNGNRYSGDNHSLHQLKDGHFVAILSDGMGHGPKAAEESRITVNVLERLLENGINRDFAIQMVNAMMSLRTPEETFATVDLTMIDLYTARAEFIKIGAAATYIKRGREVWSIKSTSLPVGILNTVDVERTVSQLQAGDLIIMATDGVVDSKADNGNKEDWLVRALSKVEVVGPEALGEYLLNLAKINQDGEPKDDMTVVVLQIDKRDNTP
ncbi:MAG: stage II sporulation protein E [Bacillota bacterium]|jgi:stage II sporulation protein E